MATTKRHDVKDLALASEGIRRIEWADRQMPVLAAIRERFHREQPLAGYRISACLHVTTETANLARTLKAGGADVVLCASNPLSTQDDVAAALVDEYDIAVFAIKGEDNDTYYAHIEAAVDHKPQLTMDDGADVIGVLHSARREQLGDIIAGTEETTTGVIRLKALEADGALGFPIIAVNDAQTKHLFDNRYGTGQSTIDGIIRATNVLLAGKRFVVAGYGWVGRGVASRARGMGSHVIITEVDPMRALEASMDGYEVLTMEKAASIGDIFCTATGDKSVIRKEHIQKMKDGAILANTGHFNVEIDIPGLRSLATETREARAFVEEFTMAGGQRLYLIADGRLVNLSAAEGHPALVMDMSFANQALSAEYAIQHAAELERKVYPVPEEIDKEIARLKLETMGVEIDKLTEEQAKYLASWDEGTYTAESTDSRGGVRHPAPPAHRRHAEDAAAGGRAAGARLDRGQPRAGRRVGRCAPRHERALRAAVPRLGGSTRDRRPRRRDDVERRSAGGARRRRARRRGRQPLRLQPRRLRSLLERPGTERERGRDLRASGERARRPVRGRRTRPRRAHRVVPREAGEPAVEPDRDRDLRLRPRAPRVAACVPRGRPVAGCARELHRVAAHARPGVRLSVRRRMARHRRPHAAAPSGQPLPPAGGSARAHRVRARLTRTRCGPRASVGRCSTCCCPSAASRAAAAVRRCATRACARCRASRRRSVSAAAPRPRGPSRVAPSAAAGGSPSRPRAQRSRTTTACGASSRAGRSTACDGSRATRHDSSRKPSSGPTSTR